MALLDPLFRAFGQALNSLDRWFSAATNPEVDDVQTSEVIGDIIEDTTPADEITAVLVDIVEEGILSDLQEAGELTPENVEAVTDQTEGAATSLLLGLMLSNSIIEGASLGQLDSQQDFIIQALAGLGIDDVTGTEIEARFSQGILPALEAKVAKEHRAHFVNLQDAVEILNRNKTADTGYLTGENVDPRAAGLVGSNTPVNPDNLLEEWGIRDDNLPILEEVALNDMEFEELIETPAELGMVVPEEVVRAELDRAGYAEDTKNFLAGVVDRIPQSTRVYQELIRTEDLVTELDNLVADDELTPAEALSFFPGDTEVDDRELLRRWELLQAPPAGAPTRSLIEDSFAYGLTSEAEFVERLDRLEYNTEKYDDVVQATILNDLDGKLQDALAYGLISETQFANLAERAGVDDQAINKLLAGENASGILKSRQVTSVPPGERSVGTIVGIGESRAAALGAVGIETVGDLAGADVETVAQEAGVSPETARQWVDSAQGRLR